MKKSLFLLCLLSTSLLLNSCGDESESSRHSGVDPVLFQKVENECRNDTERRFLRDGYEGNELLLNSSARGEDALSVYIIGAALGGHKDIVESLISEGYYYLSGAIYGTALRGDKAYVMQLLDKGADPNDGIHIASELGYYDIVKLQLESGEDPNRYVNLAIAAQNDHADIVKLLLEKEANPNISDVFFETAKRGNVEIVKILLAHPGINVNVTNHFSQTPLDLALYYNHKECADLIREAGGKHGYQVRSEKEQL